MTSLRGILILEGGAPTLWPSSLQKQMVAEMAYSLRTKIPKTNGPRIWTHHDFAPTLHINQQSPSPQKRKKTHTISFCLSLSHTHQSIIYISEMQAIKKKAKRRKHEGEIALVARSSLTSCSDQDSLRAIVQGHLEPEMGLGSAMAIQGKDLISQVIDITADGTTAVYSLRSLFTSAAKTRDHLETNHGIALFSLRSL